MGDYIRTPVLPEKCPKCGNSLDVSLECIKGCGFWEYLHGFWVWH